MTIRLGYKHKDSGEHGSYNYNNFLKDTYSELPQNSDDQPPSDLPEKNKHRGWTDFAKEMTPHHLVEAFKPPVSETTSEKVWRYTAGRISKLADILVYSIGLLFQTGKIAIKAPVCIPASLISFAADKLGHEKTLEHWTMSAVAKDILVDGRLLQKIAEAGYDVLFAPSKESARSISAFEYVSQEVFEEPTKSSFFQLRQKY